MSTEPRSRAPLLLLAAAFTVGAGALGYTMGTRRSGNDGVPSAQPSATTTAEDVAAASGAPGSDEVRPVYPVGSAPVPAAVALCDALYGVPLKRRAQCCHGPAPASGFAPECARNLSGAIASGQVEIADADVATCAAAMQKLHESCDWVVPFTPGLPAPKECQGLLKGKLSTGAVCRSGYECKDGLYCHGVGPTSPGKCGPPKEQGTCNTGVDVLGTYLKDHSFESRHPECAGYCLKRGCVAFVKLGEECVYDGACGPKAQCIAGKCAKPVAPRKAGESCGEGRCEDGLRCLNDKCTAPRREGEPCDSNAECRGQCAPPTDGAKGTCSPRCGLDIKMPEPKKKK